MRFILAILAFVALSFAATGFGDARGTGGVATITGGNGATGVVTFANVYGDGVGFTVNVAKNRFTTSGAGAVWISLSVTGTSFCAGGFPPGATNVAVRRWDGASNVVVWTQQVTSSSPTINAFFSAEAIDGSSFDVVVTNYAGAGVTCTSAISGVKATFEEPVNLARK